MSAYGGVGSLGLIPGSKMAAPGVFLSIPTLPTGPAKSKLNHEKHTCPSSVHLLHEDLMKFSYMANMGFLH